MVLPHSRIRNPRINLRPRSLPSLPPWGLCGARNGSVHEIQAPSVCAGRSLPQGTGGDSDARIPTARHVADAHVATI